MIRYGRFRTTLHLGGYGKQLRILTARTWKNAMATKKCRFPSPNPTFHCDDNSPAAVRRLKNSGFLHHVTHHSPSHHPSPSYLWGIAPERFGTALRESVHPVEFFDPLKKKGLENRTFFVGQGPSKVSPGDVSEQNTKTVRFSIDFPHEAH